MRSDQSFRQTVKGCNLADEKCRNTGRNSPAEKREYGHGPFEAGNTTLLFDIPLAAADTEVDEERQQRHEQPEDRHGSPEQQRLKRKELASKDWI